MKEVTIKIELKYALMLLWILQNLHPVLDEFDRAYKRNAKVKE